MEWGPGDFGGLEIETATWVHRIVLSPPSTPFSDQSLAGWKEALRGWGAVEH